jgi:hypothetical protein
MDGMTDFDEDAALEAVWESLAAPHPQDILKREHDRQLKGYPRDIGLEKWGDEIEEMIMRDLKAKEARKPRGQVLQMVKPKGNQPE